jgi:PhnB protein
MQIQPYLVFHGRCEEAVEFYRTALGATAIELMRFNQAPDPVPPGVLDPGFENKIMHGTFRLGDAQIMVSDGGKASPAGFQGFSLAIIVTTPAEADRVFGALAQGGKVGMPLGKTFWSPRFGTVTDRFGVDWMVNTMPQ